MTERPEVVEEHDSAPFRAALKEAIRRHAPSLVQLEFTQMALYAPDCEGLPTLLVEHDITLDLYTQLLEQKEDWETRAQLDRWIAFEHKAWREVDCVVAMSDKDRGMVEGARRVVALPNGVDLERFQPSGSEPEPADPVHRILRAPAQPAGCASSWPKLAGAARGGAVLHHRRFRPSTTGAVPRPRDRRSRSARH